MYKLSQYLLGFIITMSLGSFASAQGNLFCSSSWWSGITFDGATRTIELYRDSLDFAMTQTCNQQGDTPFMIALRSIPEPISSDQAKALIPFFAFLDEHNLHHVTNRDGYTAWIISQLRWQRALRRWNDYAQNHPMSQWGNNLNGEVFEATLFILLMQADPDVSFSEALGAVIDDLTEHTSDVNTTLMEELDRLEELLERGFEENLLPESQGNENR